MKSDSPCIYLPWDSDFFGCRIARVTDHVLHTELARKIDAWSKEHSIDCLYFLADATHHGTVRVAEDSGFRLMDVCLTLERKSISSRPGTAATDAGPAHVRHARPDDVPILKDIARRSHSCSRFYYDPHFSEKACESLYATWIERSCQGWADVVLVVEKEGQPTGYAACHLPGEASSVGRLGLLGVAPQGRGGNLGRLLVNHSLKWFAAQGVDSVHVTTQGRNLPAQRLYQRCGFISASLYLWYHKWLHCGGSESHP